MRLVGTLVGPPQASQVQAQTQAVHAAAQPYRLRRKSVLLTQRYKGRSTEWDEAEVPQTLLQSSESLVEIYYNISQTTYFTRTGRVVQKALPHLGAGFVWDEAGHLVTAYHVMEDCFRHNVQPRVRLVARGTSYRATFIGGDMLRDIAVLRVDTNTRGPRSFAANFQPAKLGDSSRLQLGQLVYVLGKRTQWEGLRPAIESGYAAGLVLQLNAGGDAGLHGRRHWQSLFSSIPVDRGYSGGPICDAHGRVVGVHWGSPRCGARSAPLPQQRSAALPIGAVEALVGRVLDRSRVLRPMAGVLVVEEIGAEELPGVPVIHVLPGSPAAAAGIKGGRLSSSAAADPLQHLDGPTDLIVGINGTRVTTTTDIHDLLDHCKAGDRVEVEVMRDEGPLSTGRLLLFEVQLQQQPLLCQWRQLKVPPYAEPVVAAAAKAGMKWHWQLV
ncbi:hypothetical protein N2152v2_000791 [Parachlorella kessleri]